MTHSHDRRFGKKAARLDHQGIQLSRGALMLALPVVSDRPRWAKSPADVKQSWPFFKNNDLGCCVLSAKAIIQLHMTRVAQGYDLSWTDADVIRAYQLFGYVPGQPATDRGVCMADAVRLMLTTGVRLEHQQAPDVWTMGFGVDHTDIDMICRCIDLFGFCDLGWQLRQNMAQSTNGVWSWDATSPIAGPHDACAIDFRTVNGKRELKIVTWTEEFWATEDVVMNCADEAWSGVSRENWTNIHGASPILGTTFAELLSYAQAIGH